ncbi:flagellar hook-associated protein FlgL [Tolumonas lignilytica]|jgi:flagellar hook-associated protein 3|uniref:flagellar hook-associated protein FlgL n=1 Tax=Tolumonas lignilytica TaxID=1283284 RepID=UPI000465C90F|nr:flagellar hook-associated protein FlgL [Tolumonas lignilytica]
MRLSTNMMYQQGIRSIQTASQSLDTANQQMTSGDKFTSSGEDPIGMSQKLSLSSQIGLYNQYNTNGGLLNSSLSLEETVLNSVNTGMMSAYTAVQSANNTSMSADDRASIATQLEETQKQLYDLMNSKNADGEYIFGGNQSQTQPFVKDSAGIYQFQGDTGQRQIQIAPSVQVASNDSGLSLFQAIPTRRTASATSANLSVDISDQSQYDTYYRNNYDFSVAANNSFKVTTTAGVPDQYQIVDNSGATLQSGTYQAGTAINYHGLSLTMNIAAGSSVESFKFDTPQNDNILNTLSQAIAILKDPNSTTADIQKMAADTQSHLSNAMDKVNTTLGEIGGRMTNADQIANSNTSLNSISQEAKANVSQVDMYAAISKVAQEQNALTVAQQAYTKINKSTLFDYI